MSTDGQIDQLVKARWLALGLSQKDLVEVLGAPSQAAQPLHGAAQTEVGRLMQVADAFGVSHDLFHDLAPAPRKVRPSLIEAETMEALLELRLLRLFRELQDHNAKRMLIQLAEQIVKRQVRPSDNAG